MHVPTGTTHTHVLHRHFWGAQKDVSVCMQHRAVGAAPPSDAALAAGEASPMATDDPPAAPVPSADTVYNQCLEGNLMMKKKRNAFWIAHIQFTRTSTGIGGEGGGNCSYAMHATKVFTWNAYKEQGQ